MDTVVLMPGPTHLFFTTGVYYTYLLSKKFKVVLVLDKKGFNPKPEVILRKIKDIDNIIVEFIEPGRNRFSYFLNLYRNSDFILDKYKPKFVLLHNTVYLQDIYLFMESRRRKIPVIKFLGALLSEDTEKEKKLFARAFEKNIRGRNTFSRVSDYLKSTIIYKIIPLFLINRFCYPTFDVYLNRNNGTRDKKVEIADFLLVYSQKEKDILKKQGFKDNRVMVVQHPVEMIGDEVNRLMYPHIEEENSIVVLPTYGIVSFLLKKGKENLASVTNKWIEIIGVLMLKFSYKIILKLHPAQAKDKLWQHIVNVLKSKYNSIEVVPPEESAQELILKSRIVISEFSSVLWWAKFIGFGNKILISINLFNVPLGDYFRNEEGVYYFETIEELKATELRPYSSHKRNKMPDLISFLSAIS